MQKLFLFSGVMPPIPCRPLDYIVTYHASERGNVYQITLHVYMSAWVSICVCTLPHDSPVWLFLNRSTSYYPVGGGE